MTLPRALALGPALAAHCAAKIGFLLRNFSLDDREKFRCQLVKEE